MAPFKIIRIGGIRAHQVCQTRDKSFILPPSKGGGGGGAHTFSGTARLGGSLLRILDF